MTPRPHIPAPFPAHPTEIEELRMETPMRIAEAIVDDFASSCAEFRSIHWAAQLRLVQSIRDAIVAAGG